MSNFSFGGFFSRTVHMDSDSDSDSEEEEEPEDVYPDIRESCKPGASRGGGGWRVKRLVLLVDGCPLRTTNTRALATQPRSTDSFRCHRL